jgi:hypothetical protein
LFPAHRDRNVITISTNVCASDDVRIRHTLPSWLRTFPEVGEFVVVVDETPPSGRIARLHRGHGNLTALYSELDAIRAQDARVRVVPLTGTDAESVLSKWFGPRSFGQYPFISPPRPIRCQAGTPILAFIFAVEAAQGDTVLRTDCDMLFSNRGWLSEAARLLQRRSADLVEPRRLGEFGINCEFSTRAFALNKRHFAQRLPIAARVLDPARFLHRLALKRPPWLALEQMIERARERGRLSATMLPTELGNSMHVATHQQASLPWFYKVPPLVELDEFPEEQVRRGPNFSPEAWQGVFGDGVDVDNGKQKSAMKL